MESETQNRRRGNTESTTKGRTEHLLLGGNHDPEFASVVEDDLEDLAQLRPDWDGYGAPAINRDIIAAAREFIRCLPENLISRPHVVPMASGNVQFEWHHGTKILEFEFEDAQTIHFLQWHSDAGVEEEATFPIADVDRAVVLIQWFTSGTCV